MEASGTYFSILSDPVETVAPWLVDRILSNTTVGVRFQRLTRPKVMMKFLESPVHRRRVFD
jgi:hypothetical protein